MKLKHLIKSQGSWATEIKTAWHWRTDEPSEEWNRTQNPEAAPHRCSRIVFYKVQKQLNGGLASQSANALGITGYQWAKKEKNRAMT